MIQIITIPEFEKSLKKLSRKYQSLKAEYLDFIEETENNHLQGRSLGNGFYKARLSVKSKRKGKSGGLRIISHREIIYEQVDTKITLVSIYDKSEISSIDKKYLQSLLNKYK
ncbi:MAG: type II toxin-antitoxin system RelE/ParE family toxin [Prolixibacteraceae bacterium]